MIIEPLEIFTKVAEEKSFSKAAEELYLSQPSVSQQIRNLENEFDTKLIYRSSKHVKLTPAGEILYRRAAEIMAIYAQAKDEINLIRHVVTGRLRIGASFTIGEYVLPRLVGQTAVKYPRLDIAVTIANTEQIAQSLSQNHLDIGLVEGRVNADEFSIELFWEDEMVLIAPVGHPLSTGKPVTPAALQDQVWINREAGSGTRAFSDRFIQALDLQVQRSYVFSSSKGVKEAVVNGLGIAIVSRLIIEKELAGGDLVMVPVEQEAVRLARNFVILRMPQAFCTKAVEVFLEELRSNY